MLRFLKRIGRRLGLVKAEAPTIALDDDWLGKLLKALEPNADRPIMFAWSALPRPSFTDCDFADCHFADADRRLQLAAEQFAAAVIDALQNG